MFELYYLKDGVKKHHIDVDYDILFVLLKCHQDKEIQILSMEDSNHHFYDVESLINNLKL